MGLKTKIDKQIDYYYEVVSTKKGSAKQNNNLKFLVLLLFVFNVLWLLGELFDLSVPIAFSFGRYSF